MHWCTLVGMPAAAPDPPLDALMTFLSVARLGRYTAAADVLGVNHSTVSRRITALESAMGGRVLVGRPEDGRSPSSATAR